MADQHDNHEEEENVLEPPKTNGIILRKKKTKRRKRKKPMKKQKNAAINRCSVRSNVSFYFQHLEEEHNKERTARRRKDARMWKCNSWNKTTTTKLPNGTTTTVCWEEGCDEQTTMSMNK
mmetsp:Transcript_7696/g.11855  ORF Transcript_7696/g.11855 Transcript_7696/m.11855 type:complete len:120 (+) Transcript_7696:223-582(+)